MALKYSTALVLSFILHCIIAVVLLFGEFSSHEKPTPTMTATAVTQENDKIEPIKAVTVDKTKLEARVKQIRKQKADEKAAEAKRIRDLERRASDAQKKRAKEQARIKSLEKQRKQKEQDKKRADEAARQAKAKAEQADKLRKAKEQEQQQAEKAAAAAKAKRLREEAEAKKAEDLRKKKEAERKRKEQEARERALEEQMLAEQMAQEMAERQKARRAQMQTEIQRFTALITQTIQRNLITDRSTMEGKSCKLAISLAPSGFVTNVQATSGDTTVCNAAKTAVLKAGTLPVSKDPEVFNEMRNISFTFRPEF
ncbi:protein TolA [Thalassotalea eurytherma]|uniref:Protein TolA n=1 Tax=Thalassotalea eurytherma TaxID=1144278 RepID=A0ABQ6H5R2_9GAMM|nr:protein TolA [Thalassotalea eurytherma]